MCVVLLLQGALARVYAFREKEHNKMKARGRTTTRHSAAAHHSI